MICGLCSQQRHNNSHTNRHENEKRKTHCELLDMHFHLNMNFCDVCVCVCVMFYLLLVDGLHLESVRLSIGKIGPNSVHYANVYLNE